MIYILTTILPVLGYSFFINYLFKLPLERLVLPVCSCIILVLYISGIYNLLAYTATILIYAGFLFSAFFFILHIKNKTIKTFLTYNSIFFIAGVIFLILLTQSHYYSYLSFNDDFSHWGRISKVISYNNRLANTNDPVWFIDYPPGTALFHYFSMRLSEYSENAAYFSQGFLIICAYTFLFSVLNVKKLSITLFCLFYFYLLSFSFGHGFHTLAVDLLVGVLFGTVLTAYWFNCESPKIILLISPVILLLPLIKSVGTFFAIISLIIITLDWMIITLNNKNKKVIPGVIYITSIFIILFTIQYSWKDHLHNEGADSTFSTNISFSKIAESFDSSTSTERQKTTIENFLKKLSPIPSTQFSGVWEGFYSWLVFFLILCAIMTVHFSTNKNNKKKLAVFFIGLYTGLFIYLFSLLILYMFSFSEYEGVRTGSLDRYLKIYLISIVIFQSFVLLNIHISKNKNIINTILFSIILCLCIFPNFGKAVKGIKLPLKNWSVESKRTSDVEKIIDYTKEIKVVIPDNSHIYFIWQNNKGYLSHLFGYEMIPRNTNYGCWSIGDKYYEEDIWTCSQINTDKFIEILEKYDFLFIGKADQNFWGRFQELFKINDMHDGALFKINKLGNFALIKIKY